LDVQSESGYRFVYHLDDRGGHWLVFASFKQIINFQPCGFHFGEMQDEKKIIKFLRQKSRKGKGP